MSGQWCVDVVLEDPLELDPLEVEPPELDPLEVDPPEELAADDPVDDDVVLEAVDVLAVVAARFDVPEPEVVAPDTSMPTPRLKPRAPATTPAATIG